MPVPEQRDDGSSKEDAQRRRMTYAYRSAMFQRAMRERQIAHKKLPVEERLLTPGEVAKLFRVNIKTVGRWAQSKRLRHVKTPGGHRRFFETDVRAFLQERETNNIGNDE